MIKVYSFLNQNFNSRKILDEYKKTLPEKMQQKADRYLSQEATYNYVAGRMLLNKGLYDFGLIEQFEKIQFSPKGKPLVKGIHFNISHSDDLVICAFAKSEFGIDIEKKREINLSDFESFFTKKEWEEINENEKPIDTFFRFWVRKESIIKCLGVTLKALNQIDTSLDSDFVFYKNEKLFLTKVDFGVDCFGCVCGSNKIDKIERITV